MLVYDFTYVTTSLTRPWIFILLDPLGSTWCWRAYIYMWLIFIIIIDSIHVGLHKMLSMLQNVYIIIILDNITKYLLIILHKYGKSSRC